MKKFLSILFASIASIAIAAGPNPTPGSSDIGRQLLNAPNAGAAVSLLGINPNAVALTNISALAEADIDDTNRFVFYSAGANPQVVGWSNLLRGIDARASRYNVLAWGAKGDGMELTNATIAAGSQTLVSFGAAFQSTDVGKTISVIEANGDGTNLVTTISAVNSTSNITLSATATVGKTNWQAYYGTDDSAAINAILDSIGAQRIDAELFFPPKHLYLLAGGFEQHNGDNWMVLRLPVVGANDKKYSIKLKSTVRPGGGGGVFQGNMPYTDSAAVLAFVRSPNYAPLDQVVTNACGIGFPNAVTGSGSFGLNNLSVELENLVFRTWHNPTLTPVNFARMAYGRLTGCNADNGWISGRMTQPSYATFGFVAANGQNWPGMSVIDCEASGYGSGFKFFSDLTVDRCRSFLNNSIFTIGDSAYGALNIGYMWASYCPTGIVHNSNFGPWPGINVQMLDFEVGTSNAPDTAPWMHYKNLVYNANNTARGRLHVRLTSNYGAWTNYGEGTTTIPLLKVGGDYLDIHRVGDDLNGTYREALNLESKTNGTEIRLDVTDQLNRPTVYIRGTNVTPYGGAYLWMDSYNESLVRQYTARAPAGSKISRFGATGIGTWEIQKVLDAGGGSIGAPFLVSLIDWTTTLTGDLRVKNTNTLAITTTENNNANGQNFLYQVGTNHLGAGFGGVYHVMKGYQENFVQMENLKSPSGSRQQRFGNDGSGNFVLQARSDDNLTLVKTLYKAVPSTGDTTLGGSLTISSNAAPATPVNGITLWVSNNMSIFARWTNGVDKLVISFP